MEIKRSALEESYDRVAHQYAERFFDELRHKPLDRSLLDCFAEQVRGAGPVADVGCGPGQIARYLHERGLPVVGIDLSAEMVRLAARLTPEVAYRRGSLLALDQADCSWAGATAFYAIVHLEPAQVGVALRELFRVLRPNGLLLLSFHIGRERIHLGEWWGEPVDLDFLFFERSFVEGELEAAGFAIEARIERAPCAAVEHPSQRAYLFARKPAQR